jgi:hypothetical protein
MAVLQAEAPPVLIESRFQLLALDVQIVTDCPILGRRFDYLVQGVRQDYPITAAVRFEAMRRGTDYLIREDGGASRCEADPLMAFSHLHARAYVRAHEALPRSGYFLHAASGRFQGRRFLLMGESGAGKSTLITRLLTEGVVAEGDELVLFDDEAACALPRRFHLKSAGLHHFAWLADRIDRIPAHDNGDGTAVYSVDPSAWGFAWQIGRGPVDAIYLLEPNHGGQSRVQEIARHRMMQQAMHQLRLIDRANRGCIASLCRHLDRAYCARLTLGSLDSAAEVLLSNLATLPTAG